MKVEGEEASAPPVDRNSACGVFLSYSNDRISVLPASTQKGR